MKVYVNVRKRKLLSNPNPNPNDSAKIVREETRGEAKAYAAGEHERVRMEGIRNGGLLDSEGVVTDDNEVDADEEDSVSKRVTAKSLCLLSKDDESDLSFEPLSKSSTTHDLVMKLFRHFEGLAKDSHVLAQQVNTQAKEIIGLEVMLSDAQEVKKPQERE